MEEELPEVLYKYRDWGDDNHKKMLKNNEIFFPSGRDFNDPFECRVLVNFDGGTYEQNYDLIERLLKLKYPRLKAHEVRERTEKLMEEGLHKDPQNIEIFNKIQREHILKNNGIFSLSEKKDSILMWSHYANHHKGFSVGFKGKVLKEFCDILAQTEVLITHYRVKYLRKYPSFNSIGMTNEEVYVRPMTTKFSDWAYEDEYRLIYMDGTNKVMTMFDTAYKEIILGCKMPEDHIEEIKEVLRQNWPERKLKLLQAKRKENEFGLDFEEVDY